MTKKREKFRFSPDKGDPEGKTNAQRAAQAEEAAQVACLARGESDTVPREDAIRDLLADLGHLCDREGLNYPAILKTATADWRAER